jgi:hypothetical protein
MTLLEIPDDYWSTQWRLHIIDNSNNASVNNITINAGFGQTINNQSSVVINTNNGTAVLKILDNNQFDASFGGGASGGYLTIEDEGMPLPQRSILNFTGYYVTAFDNGVDTTIAEVNPSILNITNADLLTTITAGLIVEGLSYRVTDPLYAIEVIVMGTENDSVGLEGKAKWWVADYQGVGNYSGVTGFNSQIGRWWVGATPVIGDVAIWNNKHYVNLTGANGLVNPSIDGVNWSLLTFNTKHGYLIEEMDVLYNPTTNIPFVVKDKRYNEVHFANPKGQVTYLNFPFGDDLVFRNVIKGKESLIENLCNIHILEISENVFFSGTFDCVNLTNPNKNLWEIKGNYVQNGGQLGMTFTTMPTASVNYNQLNGGLLKVTNVQNTFTSFVNITDNVVNGGTIICGNLGLVFGNQGLEIIGNQIQNPKGKIIIKNVNTTAHPTGVSIFRNVIQGASSWYIDNMQADLIDCRAESDVDVTIETLANNTEQGGVGSVLTTTISTWRKVLDLAIGTTYDILTQTLDLGSDQHVGQYLIKNQAFGTIQKIKGGFLDSQRLFELQPYDIGGLPMVLSATAIGVAVADDIIENGSLTSILSFNAYSTYSDRVTFHRGGGALGFNFISTIQSAV